MESCVLEETEQCWIGAVRAVHNSLPLTYDRQQGDTSGCRIEIDRDVTALETKECIAALSRKRAAKNFSLEFWMEMCSALKYRL